MYRTTTGLGGLSSHTENDYYVRSTMPRKGWVERVESIREILMRLDLGGLAVSLLRILLWVLLLGVLLGCVATSLLLLDWRAASSVVWGHVGTLVEVRLFSDGREVGVGGGGVPDLSVSTGVRHDAVDEESHEPTEAGKPVEPAKGHDAIDCPTRTCASNIGADGSSGSDRASSSNP